MKKWIAYNPNDWWAIISDDGYIFTDTTFYTRSSAIKSYLESYTSAKYKDWSYWYRQGYRAVKVRIIEVE